MMGCVFFLKQLNSTISFFQNQSTKKLRLTKVNCQLRHKQQMWNWPINVQLIFASFYERLLQDAINSRVNPTTSAKHQHTTISFSKNLKLHGGGLGKSKILVLFCWTWVQIYVHMRQPPWLTCTSTSLGVSGSEQPWEVTWGASNSCCNHCCAPKTA